MVSYLADSNDVEVYTGDAWSPLAFESYVDAKPVPGLVPVIAPTVNYSGGTATANTLGEVAFTTVTSLSLNNIFNSSYRNYYLNINISASSGSSTLNWRMRASGTDNTGSLYYTGGIFGRITGNTGAFSTNGTNTGFFSWLNGEAYVSLNLANPALPVRTNGYSNALANDGASLAGISCGQSHFATTAYDGITVYPGSGNMTGTISVFGYDT
jgi:hypothetical protein